ncbi:MAG: PTS sugar transporter subunit IIA [Candidatus Cloacimonas sp.]|nr:PTS sugar transporter subunit IIA [Candidatus Cloacimonadota bacterium]
MIERYINQDLVIINSDIKTKRELFSYVSKTLAEKDYISDEQAFYDSLMERENLLNTEIYPGIAIPHTDCSSVKKVFLLILICKQGILYDHQSFGPVNIVFLFGCREKFDRDYLRLVARSARLLKNPSFVNALLSSKTPLDVINTIHRFDYYSEGLEDDRNALLIARLYKPGKLSDFLTALIEVGFNNASIIKTSSMAKLISYEIPVFAGLNLKSGKKSTAAITILSVFQDKKKPLELMSVLKDFQLDLNQPGNGYIQIINIKKIFGEVDEFR